MSASPNYTIRKPRPSRKDAMAEEAREIAEQHRRLKDEYLERQKRRKAQEDADGRA